MHVFNDKELLFALLAEGAAVITPNNRLSDSILRQYFIHRHSKTVDKPICLPYSVALINAYETHHYINPHLIYPTLLNATQCQYLWQKMIKDTPHITYSEGLLHAVISAWEHCEQWQVAPDDPSFHHTPQTHQFQQWWQLLNQQFKQHHLIAECQLIPYLINANNLFFSQPVVWVCFDDFNPQQVQLQHHLQKHQLKQYQYDLQEQSTTPELFVAKDEKEECLQLMTWLQKKIHEGNQRIGVVVPDLQQKSQALQRTLAQHFAPELFNVSLGQPLSEFPLIAHALCWLNLDGSSINPHQAALLLQSPYLGGAKEEFVARSEYLHDGALLKEQTFLLAPFIQELHDKSPILAKLLAQLPPYPQDASVQEWIQLFQERLNFLGFPGNYGLNSQNYQCLNRFTLLFDEFRQFSVFSPYLNKFDALLALQRLTHNTIFQAQKINAPIQISGLLEASGCEFDSLWFMGLTDQCLPQKVHLSAFIPPTLQRDLHMPHSLPARELQFARQTLHRLKNSAHSIIFSYAELQGDNPNLPCSLINNLPNAHPLPINTKVLENDLITLEESYSVPIKLNELIAGGTALLANQAKCPFKSFAEHRLRAKSSTQTSDGLDAKERGQILHKVMELLWQKLGSQHELLNVEASLLKQYIHQAIETALTPLKKQDSESFSASIQEVEYIRLTRLVSYSLEWEKQRAPFTIAALEQAYEINLAGLNFQVRVDRLDHVADKKWVIDYKSSLPGSKPWNEERPKEPQLLLYALLDKQINTLLLMQIKTGRIGCSGFSEEKQGISGISSLKKEEHWEDYRNNWQEQLTRLADEFQQGHCPPQPAQLTLCQQCDYHNLCRFRVNE